MDYFGYSAVNYFGIPFVTTGWLFRQRGGQAILIKPY